jgi:hypothetical protein
MFGALPRPISFGVSASGANHLLPSRAVKNQKRNRKIFSFFSSLKSFLLFPLFLALLPQQFTDLNLTKNTSKSDKKHVERGEKHVEI